MARPLLLPLPRGPRMPETPHRSPDPCVLVVDDERPIQLSIKSFLETHGYRVDCAGEREEAEALLLARTYDAVIVDLRLSSVGLTDGLDLVSFSQHRNPKTRVVLLTGYGSPGSEAEALRRGADAYLTKPRSLSDLQHVLDKLLGRTP